MKEFLKSSLFTRLSVVLGVLLVILVIFWAGTVVGYRQAEFSFRWARSYSDVFVGFNSPFIGKARSEQVIAANGAVGQVIAVRLPSIAVKAPDQVEKVVIVGPDTVIRRHRSLASTSDIRLGDMMIAIGKSDDDGRVVASFVRLMPPPPILPTASGTVNLYYQLER